jgi:hypothetical protein
MTHPHPAGVHVPLGSGWATNTVNTVIFRGHGVFSAGRFQYAAFYADPQRLCIVRRDLAGGTVHRVHLAGEYRLPDAHNSISLGIDREGHLHLAYDHHVSGLRYRRSASPHNVHDWGAETPMTGLHETQVTYPTFLMQSDGGPLLMLYRDGNWCSGSARLKAFDETSGTWSDRPTPVLSGSGERPWTANAYWNHPAWGPDGSLHLSFVWRTHSLGPEQRVNNVNVGYAHSEDGGTTWLSSRRRAFELPITPVNAEVVWPVSPGSNLMNQCSMAVDAAGRPHIAFYSDDPDGVPQYQHVWFDGRQWRHTFVSRRITPFVLAGGGTLNTPMSRPEIVVDIDNRVYLLYRADVTDELMVAQRLCPPDYIPHERDVKPLWPLPLGRAEPVIDRVRWQRDGILTMLVQHSEQPPHDGDAPARSEPVYLADWDLADLWRTPPA